MTGEERRKWLQRIRRRIAENNGIVYMQSEQHDKDCGGDCNACRAEARYIDEELRRKAKMGEEVRLASILSELLMDVDLTIGVRDMNAPDNRPKPSIIYIQSVTGKDNATNGGNNAGVALKDTGKGMDVPDVEEQITKVEIDENKGVMSIEEMNLTVHLDSTLKRYGIRNTDDLYVMLKGDAGNMKKKLRGGYKYLVERLRELGYNITEEMR